MDLVARVDFISEKITFRDLDSDGSEVGFVERRGPIWLAIVGQDDPATTWERTFDEWHEAGAAVCAELARRYYLEKEAGSTTASFRRRLVAKE